MSDFLGGLDAEGQRAVARMLVASQQRLNEAHARWLEFADYYGWTPKPLTRWQRIKRKVSNRWYAVRVRLALWIAPELDDC